MQRLLIIVFLFVWTLLANGQSHEFQVVMNKGDSEVKKSGTWTPIKVGTTLDGQDELNVKPNSYLGLIHSSGKPLQIKSPGPYKVSELAKGLAGNASVLSKYTDFILSQNEDKKNTMQATGAVVRGQTMIKVYVPESQMAIIYNPKVTLSWDDSKYKAPYTIYINSMFGDELMKTEATTNQLTIDLSDKAFKNEDNILVIVLPKGTEKDPTADGQMIKRMSKADRERIEPQIKEVSGSLGETALDKIYLAGAYEKNKLLIDAGSAYLEAIRLEPTVDSFKEMYQAFLMRNGLNAPKE